MDWRKGSPSVTRHPELTPGSMDRSHNGALTRKFRRRVAFSQNSASALADGVGFRRAYRDGRRPITPPAHNASHTRTGCIASRGP